MVVFSPQIIENIRRSSADGLSLIFLIIWLLGDVFNILGAVLQGVLPTMTILAVYYTLADIALLGQCFYYRGFTLSDASAEPLPTSSVDEEATEESALLAEADRASRSAHLSPADADRPIVRSDSDSSRRSHLSQVDGTHLSPVTPLLLRQNTNDPPTIQSLKPTSVLTAIIFNTIALLLVCAAGVLGWWLVARSSHSADPRHDRHRAHRASQLHSIKARDGDISFDTWGQIFGYLCAVLYLASRIPQILLNYRRKSTEGVSMLFFLFACVGNLTYVMSIIAYEPNCARELGVGVLRTVMTEDCATGEFRRQYGRYLLVNASWLIGSAGTLALDLVIFVQFWLYRGRNDERVEQATGVLGGTHGCE